MWKRDEGVRAPQGPTTPATPPTAGVPAAQAPVVDAPASPSRPLAQPMRDVVNIGKSVVIKGELNGSEDLTIEGQVEGKIELRQNVLTIGPNGKIKAAVFAKSVIVLGEVVGNVTASEKVDIRDNGSVDGDLISPRVAIAEGAHFRGSIDMQRQGGATTKGDVKASDVKAVRRQAVDAKPRARARRPPHSQRKSRVHHGGSGRPAVHIRGAPTARRVRPPPGATRERFHVPAQGSGRPLTDRLFGWGRRAEKERAGRDGVRRVDRAHGPDQGVQPFPVRAVAAGIADRARPGPDRRRQRQFPRRAPRLQVPGRGSLPEHRSRTSRRRTRPTWRRSSRSASRRPTPASTACCAGTCSTIWTRPRPRSWRAQMMRILKPGGAVFGFFSNEASTEKEYTRYLIVDDKTLKHRAAPGSRARQQVFANRDITRLFEGLTVSDSFLLLTKTREMVFRKPEQKADAAPADADAGGRSQRRQAGRVAVRMREPAARPVLALLTDFGTRDPYVGAMKGAALSVCADATLVDLTHDIAAARRRRSGPPPRRGGAVLPGRHRVRRGRRSGRRQRAAGAGGVGRRALVRRSGQRRADAGPHARRRDRRDHVEPRYMRVPVSRTFEGRDRFAPAAAWLLRGVPLDALGPPVTDPVRLDLPRPASSAASCAACWSRRIASATSRRRSTGSPSRRSPAARRCG